MKVKKMRLFPLNAILLTTGLITLCGCTMGPDYERPIVAVPAQFKEAPVGWKFATPHEGIDRGAWWDDFNDQTLSRLLAEVDLCNQNLIEVEAQYRQSLALVEQARAGFFPTLNANMAVSRQKTAATSGSPSNITNLYSVGLQASWEPDLWGSVRRSVEASEAEAEAAAANVVLTKLSLQTSLAQYYYELRAVDATQKLLDETVSDYKKLLVMVQNRHRMGIATGLDVAQADSQLKNAEVSAIDNQVTRSQYEHAIAVLVGKVASDFSMLVDSSALSEPPILPTVLPSALLERRPDIAQAERQMAQANATIGVNVAAYFPSLNLSSSGGYESNILSNLLNAPAKVWSLAGQMTQVLFDGGAISSKIDAAKASYDQAVASYRQTVLTAFQDTEDNLSTIRILDKEAKSQASAVIAAKKQLDLTIDQYKAGTIYFSDVVTAQINYFTARSKAISIASRRFTATAGLVKSLGGGWSKTS